MTETITSRKNEKIKFAVRLTGSAAFRKERRLFFLEGARLCRDAAQSGADVKILFYTARAAEKYEEYLKPIFRIAEEACMVSLSVAEALSETKTSQGVFCVCGMKEETGCFPCARQGDHCLALENMQDPANLGAVLRTAEALGLAAVILGGNCCDVYSPKALRASMGAVFRLPFYFAGSMEETVEQLNRAEFCTLAAVPDRTAASVTKIDFTKPSVAVIGNEGNGLSEKTIKACSQKVTIPMRGRAESLNASASAAILMWEMMRGAVGDEKP